ncbi:MULTISPECIES: phage tail assembly protein [Comamonas]|uniref:phage tail assembly protein n=1 Tax=Comamonas TaxID=283 RepID=UPI0025808725|nr:MULTISPECIES: phage tail assembly protein [Comamonas]
MNEAQEIMGRTKVVTLSQPIKAHDQEVKALELRRPTVAEVRKIGCLPYRLRPDGLMFDPDTEITAQYLVVCAGIPPSSVDQIELSDFNKLAWQICNFFAQPESSAPSN